MKKVCDFIVDNMAILIILISVLGAAVPSSLTWVGPNVSWMLGVVMFGMGMTLKFEDFRLLAKRPWEVGIGALAQFTLMPLIAWVLVKVFALPPEIAIGVVLVGTCPGGTASNVITYLAKGDVALSVAMTMTTTLLAPIVTPCLTWFLAGAWVDISLLAMMKSIAMMVLFPVIAGLIVNHFAGRTVEKFLPVLPLISVIAIALLVGGVVALSASKLFSYGVLIFAVVILHNACGLACGYLMAKLFRLTPAKARAVAIEVGMQNSGLAASLAVMYFSPLAAVPGAIFSLWHNVSGSLLANYFVRKDARDGAEAFKAHPAA
ncbi:MAG: bile acid:sodium symporter family protein [Schwartzia sp.]|nr:bile acid:sodium symporter family protein [Schwartzia sp. (in: firmicutes)]